jgi:hypothetical protein
MSAAQGRRASLDEGLAAVVTDLALRWEALPMASFLPYLESNADNPGRER